MSIGLIGLILGLIVDLYCKFKKVKNNYKIITYVSLIFVIIGSVMTSKEEAATLTNYLLQLL